VTSVLGLSWSLRTAILATGDDEPGIAPKGHTVSSPALAGRNPRKGSEKPLLALRAPNYGHPLVVPENSVGLDGDELGKGKITSSVL